MPAPFLCACLDPAAFNALFKLTPCSWMCHHAGGIQSDGRQRISYLKSLTELRPCCGENGAVEAREACPVDLPALTAVHIEPTALTLPDWRKSG